MSSLTTVWAIMVAYEAIDTDGQRVGGAIIAIDAAKHHGELSFLQVPHVWGV